MESQTLTLTDPWLEILKRVPSETLGNCMCVCKSWYTLIVSPYFIATHIKAQSFNHTHHFILRDYSKPTSKPGKETYFLYYDPQKDPPLLKRKFLSPSKARLGLFHRVVGSVNGVICLSDDLFGYTYNIVLWNPLVCKFIKVPKARACFDAVGAYMFALGFGYDSVSSDYKVVRLTYPQDRVGLDETPPLVEVYSVREAGWRWVNADGVEICIPEKGWSQCFVRGSVHWVGFDRREGDRGYKSSLLLLFDVEKEKFKKMKLPVGLSDVCPLYLVVCEFRGLLSVRHYQRSRGLVGDLLHFDLWVKNQYTDGKSWSKMFSIDGDSGIDRVLYSRQNGEMMATRKEGGLVCYSPETKEMVGLDGDDKYRSFVACSFMESLAFLEKDSPAVSCMQDHNSRDMGLVPGTANAEKGDEIGSRSNEDKESAGEAEKRLLVPGTATVEKEDETGSSSSSDDEYNAGEAEKRLLMGTVISITMYYQMMKFRHEF